MTPHRHRWRTDTRCPLTATWWQVCACGAERLLAVEQDDTAIITIKTDGGETSGGHQEETETTQATANHHLHSRRPRQRGL